MMPTGRLPSLLKQQIPSRAKAVALCHVARLSKARVSGPVVVQPRRASTSNTTEHKHTGPDGDTVDAGHISTTGQNSLPGQSRTPYWRTVEIWQDITEEQFMNHRWQTANIVEHRAKLIKFLHSTLPAKIPPAISDDKMQPAWTREEFVSDVEEGMKVAPMNVRLTPHILSVVNWADPLNDPIRRQFIPLKSTIVPDHPKLTLDSLHEEEDMPVKNLVHRYPDKVLFLATSVCPVYCRYCTRSYAVGGHTSTIKKNSIKPGRSRWEEMFKYIEQTPIIQDVVLSGGDSYYLQPEQLREIGERLLSIPNIKRVRVATKGLAVSPVRILNRSDGWTNSFLSLSNQGRKLGKQVAMHTHFNHPNEITWITELAAQYLFEQGVIVRNQTVLLRGVNDNVATMSALIRKLAELNITPYYVYQSDMVKGIEDLRTPLYTINELEKQIRGTIAGFMMPSFIVDVPGGGGKRLANSFESYDRESGLSTWKAPGVSGDETYEYYDPITTTTVQSTA
ncbi:hypothetical protein LTR86_011097 [Recurvomyces mirabilis]|nr:hypothetical protein LTR86_011097 [Recurvomyces mirabilis]